MQPIDMSPLGLFAAAGPVGKTVMAGLFVASIWTWVVVIEVWLGTRALGRAVARGAEAPLLAPLVVAGRAQADLVVEAESPAERRGRIGEAMMREAQTLVGAVERGLPTLAMIASAAPFVGLFGTVWGIMSSFMGIAAAQDTSLAVVAPGIAEALAATAIGLAAAIPASLGYNRLAASLGRVGQRLHHHVEREAAAYAVAAFTTYRLSEDTP